MYFISCSIDVEILSPCSSKYCFALLIKEFASSKCLWAINTSKSSAKSTIHSGNSGSGVSGSNAIMIINLFSKYI